MATAIRAEKRENLGKGAARRLRKEGWIPAILYGLKQKPVPLKVDQKITELTFNHDEKMHQTVDLSLEEKGKTKHIPVVLKDYQADIISRVFTHIDFLQIDLKEKIQVSVPVHFVGRAAGIKEGGILMPFLRAVEIWCLPSDIPEFIDYDVTELMIGQIIHVREITLPKNCELLAKKADLPLVTVTLPKEEELPAASLPEAAAAAGAPAGGAATPQAAATKEQGKEGAPPKEAAGAPKAERKKTE